MSEEITITAKCSCGYEFELNGRNFEVSSDGCDCCGTTYNLELLCPGCRKYLVLINNRY